MLFSRAMLLSSLLASVADHWWLGSSITVRQSSLWRASLLQLWILISLNTHKKKTRVQPLVSITVKKLCKRSQAVTHLVVTN